MTKAISRPTRFVLALVLVGALGVGLLASSASGQDSFYDGETLEIIVAFGTGGGTDVFARMLAPHLQRHLGEGAAVQVVNLPGAGGLAGTNEFALQREADGRTVLISSSSVVIAYLLGEAAVQFDFRDWTPILAETVGGVAYVDPGLGVSSAAELADVDESLYYGGISATGLDSIMLITWELLGIEVNSILGYEGRGPARIAFETGETNVDYQTSPAYLANVAPLVEEGRAVPLFTFGIFDEAGNVVRDPAFPDLPTVKEAYEEIHGVAPSGPAWDAYRAILSAGFSPQRVVWVHSEAPEEAIADLRAAAAAMVQDAEFQQELDERGLGDYPMYVGEGAGAAFSSAIDIPEEALEWLKDLLRDKYGVDTL